MIMTKGKKIKALKEKGVRFGEKDGAKVSLEHLKNYQITKLYSENCL